VKYADLTCEQARKPKETIDRQLNFCTRLHRMVERRSVPTDDFYIDVEAAADAVHRLSIKPHYASMPSGVAMKPKE
jgi:hypothetical protein